MLNKETAKQKVLEYIQKDWILEDTLPVILDEETIEKEFGWVFFYQSSRYLESGNAIDMLFGNAPIIVNKHDGTIQVAGIAQPIEEYLRDYEKARKR